MKNLALFLLMTVFFFITCQRIDQSGVEQGDLNKIILQNVQGIPTEYGSLISVTTHAQYEGWAQLWFSNETGTIHMVRVQFHNNRIDDQVLVIPRN